MPSCPRFELPMVAHFKSLWQKLIVTVIVIKCVVVHVVCLIVTHGNVSIPLIIDGEIKFSIFVIVSIII